MKKLMISAAIVCAAAFAQAASFTWGTTAGAMAPAIDLANMKAGTYGNGTTTLKDMTAITWAYEMTLTKGKATDTLSGNLAYKGAAGLINVKSLSSTLMEKPAEGQPDVDVGYSIVISGTYNDGKYDYTITSDAITGTKTLSSLANLDIQSGIPSSWTVTGGGPGPGPDPTPTPEPTSGLLLLLGVAGLSLRRRRA